MGRLTSVTGTAFAGETNFASNFQYRAWNAMRGMTFGQGGTVTAAFNERMQATEHKAMGVPIYGQTTATMSWGKPEYYPNGQPKYVQDKLDANFDRAWRYDHVGRVQESAAGILARDIRNGTNSGPATVPYQLTYAWNAWDEQTAKSGKYWSAGGVNVTAGWQNGRHDGWSYDVAGNLLNDGSSTFTYDAVGRNAAATAPGWDGDPVTRNQSFDGDGQVISQNTNAPFVENYLRSTVLGGAVVVVIDGQVGWRRKAHLSADGGKLADLTAYSDGTNQGITWRMEDPVTGRKISGSKFTNQYGTSFVLGRPTQPDPEGIDVSNEDPFISYTSPEPGVPGLPGYDGNPPWNPLSPRYYLNGMEIPQEMAVAANANGMAVIAPPNQIISIIRHGERTWAIWQAAQGGAGNIYSGYVPIGEKHLGDGVLGYGDGRLHRRSGELRDTNLVAINGASGEAELGRIVGAGVGPWGQQKQLIDKSITSQSSCGNFVRGIVGAVDEGLRVRQTLNQLGTSFLAAAQLASELGEVQKFDGFQEIYTGKANARVGQKWAVYQHVYGFIGASLFGKDELPFAVRWRTGAKTGEDLVNKQLQEDTDQFDHPERFPGHPREEAQQELADDIAGIAAGNHIRLRYEGKIGSARLRQNLFGLFCDR